MKKACLYLRVSTDKQTVSNQEQRLRTIAEARGWEVVTVYSDEGISGAKGRADRPALDAMLKDASRRRFDVVMAFAIDRLGRSLADLIATIDTLHASGVDLFIDQQNVDTTTPAGKLLFQVLGAFAEFERAMIRQRVYAGMARAREQGVRIGRPECDSAKLALARTGLANGWPIRKVATVAGLSFGTVQRLAKKLTVTTGLATSSPRYQCRGFLIRICCG
jgi:DNA invertase Pin-like site-specific DNA recombinase